MSITGTLTSAMTGLNLATRAAEIVANNIANARTEGYGRRELITTSRAVGANGAGVEVTGVRRITNLVLLSDRRIAEAGSTGLDLRAAFLRRTEGIIGTPGSDGGLSDRIASFDAALIEAASRPESEARLTAVLAAATGLAGHIATAAGAVQVARSDADDAIAADIGQLNTALARVAEMNDEIRTQTGAGRDTSALKDQRQQLVDQIATIMPIRELARQDGQIALYTPGGLTLLEGRAVTFGFVPVGVVTADMTVQSGALSGLTVNGKPMPSSGAGSVIGGGSLAAHFAVRDELAPQAQAQLDAVARDLIGRFAAPGLDPSRDPGDPGLFTDAGRAFAPRNETGLAQRLAVNARVDPPAGGDIWRLRDGLGAAAPGAAGDATLLSAFQAALIAPQNPASGGFMTGPRSFSGLAADLISGVAGARLRAESEASFAGAKTDALRIQEKETGVDTDRELQDLLQIEQAYAASAKVMQAVDEMIKRLMEL